MTQHTTATQRIQAYLVAHPRSTRARIVGATGTSISDFYTAIPALGLTSRSGAGAQQWSLPSVGMATRMRDSAMTAPAYVQPEMTAPRAGSLAYRDIPSVCFPL